jgi:hypothetical protein
MNGVSTCCCNGRPEKYKPLGKGKICESVHKFVGFVFGLCVYAEYNITTERADFSCRSRRHGHLFLEHCARGFESPSGKNVSRQFSMLCSIWIQTLRRADTSLRSPNKCLNREISETFPNWNEPSPQKFVTLTNESGRAI